MTTIELLQAYWWLIISVLGAALVFMLFVQGGQSMLRCGLTDTQRQLVVNSLGLKWELTFTTLVVFGGAFFASFPLFYSTSFGGAYWLWMLILLSFVVQAVSYEFRRKRGNIYGTRTYDAFLMFNGLFGCVLIGVAVGMMFFGGDFTVSRINLVDVANPVISTWAPTHGLEAIANWRCLLLGFVIFYLARTLASLYFINNIDADIAFSSKLKHKVLINGAIFVVLFITFMIVLMLSSGYRITADGILVAVDNIYLENMLSMWYLGLALVLGVLAVLYGIVRGAFDPSYRKGIWWTGVGSFVVVLSLLLSAGWNNTAYLPSNIDPSSSLTIANSSSSQFTLTVMSWVSLLIPFVLAYIAYVWANMNARPIGSDDLDSSH